MKRENLALIVSVLAALIAAVGFLHSYRLSEREHIVSVAASRQAVVETLHEAWIHASQLAESNRRELRQENDPDIREQRAVIMHKGMKDMDSLESLQAKVKAVPLDTRPETLIVMEEIRGESLALVRELQDLLKKDEELTMRLRAVREKERDAEGDRSGAQQTE